MCPFVGRPLYEYMHVSHASTLFILYVSPVTSIILGSLFGEGGAVRTGCPGDAGTIGCNVRLDNISGEGVKGRGGGGTRTPVTRV